MQRPEDLLFARFQRERDPDDLARVYDLLAPRLLRVAAHLTPGSTEAVDLLQATFVAAIESVDRYDTDQAVRSWLLGILANRARLARWYGAREPDPEGLVVREPEDPACSAEESEFKEWFDEALRELPAAFRQTLSLRFRQGLSTHEIAHALSRPSGTIRSQLTRGLAFLRRALPAGFAGGAALIFGERTHGLAAVRARILTHVPHVPRVTRLAAGKSAAIGLTTIALLMKPVAISVVVMLVFVGLWSTLGGRARRSPEPVEFVAAPTEPLRTSDTREAPRADMPRAELPVPEVTEAGVPLAPSSVGEALESDALAFGDLEVRVLRKVDETPVPGAVVLVDATPQSRSFPLTFSARADENGIARMSDLPAGLSLARLLRGSRTTVRVPPSATGETGTAELYLFEGITVGGEVLDELERPVPGAEIWLSDRWEWSRGAVVARANRAGRFLLEGLFHDQFLSARAPGQASSHLYRVRGEVGATREFVIRLRGTAGRISGMVYDAEGEPVAEAQVLVGSEEYLPRYSMEDGSLAPAAPPILLRTGTGGHFETGFLEPGPVLVQARREGLAPGRATVNVRAGQTAKVELSLDPGVMLVGTVRDHGGRGVGAAQIRVGRVQHFGSSHTTSAPSGEFRLANLSSGELLATAVHRLRGSDEERLEARSGDLLRWDPELDARAPENDGIHGFVRDADGIPLEGFKVIARIRNAEGQWSREVSKPTASDGAFLLEVLDDRERTLWVQGPGGHERFPERILHGVVRGPHPLEIRLGGPGSETGKITGLVVDENGAAADDARLEVWHDDEQIWREFHVNPNAGRFEILHVPPGKVQIAVKSASFIWLPRRELQVSARETIDLGQLVLDRGGRVIVRFDGAPPPGALEDMALSILTSRMEPTGILTRVGNEFRSGPLPEGQLQLFTQAPFVARVDRFFEVEPGVEQVLTLTLQRSGTRRVVMEVSGGVAPAGLWMSLRDPAGRLCWQYTGAGFQREVLISALPGTYALIGGTSNGLRLESALTITGFTGNQPPLTLALQRGED